MGLALHTKTATKTMAKAANYICDNMLLRQAILCSYVEMESYGMGHLLQPEVGASEHSSTWEEVRIGSTTHPFSGGITVFEGRWERMFRCESEHAVE